MKNILKFIKCICFVMILSLCVFTLSSCNDNNNNNNDNNTNDTQDDYKTFGDGSGDFDW